MIALKSLVVYKNRPALVAETGDKIGICLPGGEMLRVREKDIEMIHPGPCGTEVLEPEELSGDVRGAWELLEGSSVPLRELAELVYGEDTAKTAWAAYGLLQDGLYFSGTVRAISARESGEVAAEEQKRQEKQREAQEREAFLERIRGGNLDLPGDSRFLQDVEALARGRTGKCRTLKDLGRPETILEAHRLLLEKGVWTPRVNPYPARFGALAGSATAPLPPAPGEDRLDLTGLAAFAIDNPWSDDPDDALSLEGDTLWVHVADPAAALSPGSPPDLEARDRGTTLYLPEGSIRMITEAALPSYALGISPVSPALSFKITLDAGGTILDTQIIPSLVRVTRLTYREADTLAGEGGALAALFALADRNRTRRSQAGAVFIRFPEVHIRVSDEEVSIEPIESCRSADLVRECMLLAGEGAARWAQERRLPFPYISQEPGDLPGSPLPGLAGAYQLRRCMRPRTLSVRPGPHWSLGLDRYTQVTSPLRRYTDLLAHQQIRAFLREGKDGPDTILGEDELLLRLAAGDAAAQANLHAERASRTHWIMVYLSDKKDSSWEGVILEKRGNRALVLIPALGLETQVPLKGGEELNEVVPLTLKSVRIPEAEANFITECSGGIKEER
ncbi:MAG: RNB domain-containing ribonuclease [Spirochaetaceae bacterium]|jgi:exoribonuclease-2|nr:RNB domain-containing ribonuclease [Spirochaetaceae bacterium]